nr:hypothetical protein [Streptomyces malaysiensis]
MRLNPLRPLPGREPSRHCTDRAARFPVAMTSYVKLLGAWG